MSLLTLEGVYRDGRIELTEQPVGVIKARVVVTFLDDDGTRGTALRREAGLRLLHDMERGLSFGGGTFDREALYEERMRELEERRTPMANVDE